MADKRYKLLKDGLPGSAGFGVKDLKPGDIIEWDGNVWVADTRLKIFVQLTEPSAAESTPGDLWYVTG